MCSAVRPLSSVTGSAGAATGASWWVPRVLSGSVGRGQARHADQTRVLLGGCHELVVRVALSSYAPISRRSIRVDQTWSRSSRSRRRHGHRSARGQAFLQAGRGVWLHRQDVRVRAAGGSVVADDGLRQRADAHRDRHQVRGLAERRRYASADVRPSAYESTSHNSCSARAASDTDQNGTAQDSAIGSGAASAAGAARSGRAGSGPQELSHPSLHELGGETRRHPDGQAHQPGVTPDVDVVAVALDAVEHDPGCVRR